MIRHAPLKVSRLRHFRVPLFPFLLFYLLLLRTHARTSPDVTPSYALRSPRNPGEYASEYTHDVCTRVQRARTRRYSRARARARAPTRPRQGRSMCIANRITCTHIARIAHRSSRSPARFLSLSFSLLLPFTLSSPSIFSFSFSPPRSLISLSSIFLASCDAFPMLLLLLFLSEASCTISFHLSFLLAISSRNVCANESCSSINLQCFNNKYSALMIETRA